MDGVDIGVGVAIMAIALEPLYIYDAILTVLGKVVTPYKLDHENKLNGVKYIVKR